MPALVRVPCMLVASRKLEQQGLAVVNLEASRVGCEIETVRESALVSLLLTGKIKSNERSERVSSIDHL